MNPDRAFLVFASAKTILNWYWLLLSSKFKISQKALQLTVQLESVLLYTDMKNEIQIIVKPEVWIELQQPLMTFPTPNSAPIAICIHPEVRG